MFIKNSFIPDKKVNCVIIDRNAPVDAIKKLNNLNIVTVLSAEIDNNITGVSTHPDMQIFHLFDNFFVCEPTVYKYYKEVLSPYNINLLKGKTVIGCNYPNDIAYNVSRVGNVIIHRLDKTDEVILNHFTDPLFRIVNTKQGYTKCNICIVSNNAVITSDRGISKVLKNEGIDVLEISQGEINLYGAEYGFIGGTCGLISNNNLAFCGDITKHSNFKEISEFLYKYQVDITILCKQKLTDIGSIIPIT